jgi:mannose-6-phosphate isomerase-like protein (cupin superfamily)
MESRTPSIIDLDAEVAKLTMFRGLTPRTTREERRGSATLLGPYRDGILFAGKNAGISHWEDHAEDELVHVVDGTEILDIVCDDGQPKSFEVRAGMIAIVPKGTWHRFRSAEGGRPGVPRFPATTSNSMSTTRGWRSRRGSCQEERRASSTSTPNSRN